jgi:hypothetical protein
VRSDAVNNWLCFAKQAIINLDNVFSRSYLWTARDKKRAIQFAAVSLQIEPKVIRPYE